MPADVKCPECQTEMTQVGSFWICPEHGHVEVETDSLAEEPVSARTRNVFISYGRADATDFAQQLAADLEDRGHEVWFDQDSIGKGALWEVEIEQGLRAASVVTAVLTPSSVREESVCRDEVVFALNQGKPIVPVLQDSTASPTLLLARRNWIDFTEGYEAGLEALLHYLAGDDSALREPALPTITGVLPLDFGPEIARFSIGFSGREWLGVALDEWLSDERGRAFVIVGEPGIGKSAIAAWLSLTRHEEVVGIHFCTQRNTRTLDPYEMVASLVAQLHAQLPGFAEAVEAKSPETRRDTASDAFRELIVEATRALPAPSQPRLIIIDGLDEAEGQGGETVLDVLVKQAPDLPEWLRLVATTRPEARILDRTKALSPFALSADRAENQADVEDYIRLRLRTDAMQERLGDAGDGLEGRLGELAAGNFLYAQLMLDSLEGGTMSPDDLGKLTTSLGSYYNEDFAERVGDAEEYLSRYAPLLRVLTAAQGPLPFTVLAEVAGEDAEILHRRLRVLRQYLRVSEGGDDASYALFHKSLQDWLTDRNAAGEYWVDVGKGHAQIADMWLDSWEGNNDALPRHSSEAALRTTGPATRSFVIRRRSGIASVPFRMKMRARSATRPRRWRSSCRAAVSVGVACFRSRLSATAAGTSRAPLVESWPWHWSRPSREIARREASWPARIPLLRGTS